MKYNTLNPIGPDGSTDFRDLHDNAGNADLMLNSEEKAWTDRLGRERATVSAMEEATPDAIAARDAAQAAQVGAELARDGAVAGAELYPNEPAGRAAVADGETFNVQGYGDIAAYQYRRISSTTSTSLATFPASAAVQSLQRLISGSSASEPIAAVVDDESGGIHILHTPSMIQDSVHRVEELEDGGAILGSDGGILLHQNAERTIVGPLQVGHTDLPGVYVVDLDGGVHANLTGDAASEEIEESSPLLSGAYFSGVLIGANGVPISIHVPSLISERLRAGEIIATINSTTLPVACSSSDTIILKSESMGLTAQLVLRSRKNPSDRMVRSIAIKTVPVPAVAPTPVRILYIGDSIGNRQGLQMTGGALSEWGYLPEWIGTMNSSGVPSNANDETGPLGECREGWETGDYTRALTDRGVNIAPGGEAEYMAMAKTEKWLRNPFVRSQTEGDDPDDVRNGLVVDFAFYQSRFGLQTPDVVVWSMGTNDARDRAETEIYSAVSGNDALMYRRIKAAWPSVKIIRTLPGTPIDPEREPVWTSKYIPMLRAIADAAIGVSGLTVAPTWAMTNQDAAYSFATAPDPTTGFTSVASWSDAVHPVGALRIALHQALAPYIAAAELNLI